ncbi:ATP-binding protein [Cupriavidus plantarum]|uniref:ATP-binding protein n=1 Tax=Cupriavidus plantarum TaxID=942865 RepID=UPI000F2B4943|nr:ATP-binding protein [Cupriavidus plantarum]RLK29116.1 signal transduction histidine kinase [Cupriavidus plantarum]
MAESMQPRGESSTESVWRERRHDSMFVRLFFVMAAIMLAVHVLGVTVIEGLFPRPGSDRNAQQMRRAASEAMAGGATGGTGPASAPGALLQRADTDGDGDIDDDDYYGPPLRSLHDDRFRPGFRPDAPGMHGGPPGGPFNGRFDGPHREPPDGGFFLLHGLWPPHLGMVFQLAAILIASWVGARLLARPVQQLARGAGRLAQDVHAPPLDEHTGPAEARAATHALNLMQQRIRTQLAQQSRFLAAVSHDLRTPLTRMSLRIERIESNDVRYRLRQDLAEMNGLIDATLYYLRERDGATGPRQRVDVQALLQAIVDDAQEIGQDVVLVGSAHPMHAYPAELRRAVVNLVENAHRYGGAAQIVLSDSAERVVIDVCDSGPGIPPAELQRVLEPFYRVESSRSRATGGVGMGLAIAADIVARHGGELELSNRMEGGLRVRIVLPRD